MERLIITPDADPQKTGRFTAHLESTGEVIVLGSRQPLVDGVRALLARGFDSATLLTMRMAGKSYDSFKPAPISAWAKWTYHESAIGTVCGGLAGYLQSYTKKAKSGVSSPRPPPTYQSEANSLL